MVYINKERRFNHAVEVKNVAVAKAEKYEELKRPYEDWAKQEGKTDEEIKEGIEQLDKLIEWWRAKAERGEV